MVVDIEDTETEGAIEPIVEIVPAIVNALEKEDITKELIRARALEYGAITITGIDDREGLKIAKEARRTLVSTRTLIENTRYAINKDSLMLQRRNNAVAKELTAMITGIEEPIDKQIKAIESEIDKRRAEKAQAEAQRVSDRINQINQLGATYDGLTYTVYGFQIDAVEVTASPDDEFAELLQQATVARDAYAQEQARIVQEQFNESERLRLQKEEQDREAKRQEEQRKELVKMKLEARQSQLTALGFMHTQGNSMRLRLSNIFFDLNIPNTELVDKSIEEFNQLMLDIKAKNADSSELHEKTVARQLIYDRRSAALVDTGTYQIDTNTKRVFFVGSTEHFSFDELVDLSSYGWDIALQLANEEKAQREADELEKLRLQQLYNSRTEQLKAAGFIQLEDKFVDELTGLKQLHQIDVSEFTDDEFTSYLTAHAQQIIEHNKAVDRAHREKKRANHERNARLKPDKRLLLMWLKNQATYTSPGTTEQESADLVADFNERLKALCDEFKGKVNDL